MEIKFEKSELPILTDFESLIILPENRTINIKRIPGIVTAMMNNIYMPPIIISIYGELLEGNHRVAAAKELQKVKKDFGLCYVVIDPADFNMTSIEIVIMINTKFALWTQNDYLASTSSKIYDCKAITELQFFCANQYSYTLPVTSAKFLLCGRAPIKEAFMSGSIQLKEEDLELAQTIFNEIYPLYELHGFRLTSDFINHYVRSRKTIIEKKLSILSFISSIENKLFDFKKLDKSQYGTIFSNILKWVKDDDIF